MATLTEASAQARKAIKWGAIGFVGITILWYLGLAAIDYYYVLFPKPSAPPTMDFGMLPAINFPESNQRPKMSLELRTGVIGEFPDRMWVYKAPTKRSGFADSARSTEVAAGLGFLFKPYEETSSDWVWTIQDQLASKLKMNIVSGHFSLTRQWQNNPALATMANFTSENQVITETVNYLQKIGLLGDDVIGQEKVRYLRDQLGQMVSADSLNDADFVQIDFHRKTIDEIDAESKTKEVVASYPFYGTNPLNGLVKVVVSGGRTANEKYVSIDYKYTQVQYDKKATYPLKTGQQAWEELLAGGGLVTSISPKSGDIKVREIFLGYYDADDGQNFAMPIYIFLGDQGFTAYVSAINDAVIQK